jgi:alkylation response protein AidB-like acyl-CoA dehydrogenase
VCKSAVFVTQKAIQIHGGIGVTEELEIGHYFRRVTRYASLYGDRDHHLRRLMNVHPDAGATK